MVVIVLFRLFAMSCVLFHLMQVWVRLVCYLDMQTKPSPPPSSPPSVLTSKLRISNWGIRELSCRFGTPQDRNDSAPSLLLTFVELKEYCWCTMLPTEPLSFPFVTGFNRFKWYVRVRAAPRLTHFSTRFFVAPCRTLTTLTPPSLYPAIFYSLLDSLFTLQHADVNVNKVLIGNKCDMQDRSVSLAEEYEIQFFETSAKQDFRVEDAFLAIATDVKDRLMADGAAGSGPAGGHKLNSAATPVQGKQCC